MRPLKIIVISLLLYCAAQSTSVLSSASIVVRVWTDSGNAAGEETFNVDLVTRKSTSHTSKLSPAGEKPGWAKANIIDRNRNLPTFKRIVERFKETPKLSNNSDLAEVLRWLEHTQGSGFEPEDFVVASPDGQHAVIKDRLKPLLLIDVATLDTHRLLDNGGDQTPIVAWSADSRYVAFTSVKSRELSIYALAHNTTSVLVHNAPWIEELSWSPDGQLIAAFALTNRRMDKNPLKIVAATAGHPIFRNDGVLFVYQLDSTKRDNGYSVVLKRGISEQSGPHARIDWQ